MEVRIRTTNEVDELIKNVIAIGRQGGDLSIKHEKGIISFNREHWIFYATDEDSEYPGEIDEDK